MFGYIDFNSKKRELAAVTKVIILKEIMPKLILTWCPVRDKESYRLSPSTRYF